MSAIVLKLSNGDEVVARLVKETESDFFVARPRVFQVAQTPEGGFKGGLFPYLLTDPDNDSVRIERSHVVTSFPAPADLESSYEKAVSQIQLLS